MKVLLVTSEGTCGIAEHSAYLKASVEAADPAIQIDVSPALDPAQMPTSGAWDLIWLNYHAARHSQWTVGWIRTFQQAGVPVGITYHDTGVPNSAQCLALHAIADAFVVHEPCDDLPGAIYWRQGIPAPAPVPAIYHARYIELFGSLEYSFKAYDQQPVLGTVGFPYPWKNYDLLAEATAEAGWALVLLAPTATPEDCARWQRANPDTLVRTDFVPRDAVVAHLAGCDATAFLYTCHNTGTSGAIRQGLAARKPVLASSVEYCRQFRDLDSGCGVIWVVPDRQGLVSALRSMTLQRVDPAVCFLAEHDSWAVLGRRYAALFAQVVQGE